MMKDYKKECIRARAKILSEFPQLAPIVLGLPYFVVPGYGSAFVTKDGVVGMGAEYIDKYEVNDLAGCFLHEGFHIMLNHLTRVGPRDKEVWNIAADIVINETIRRMTKHCQERIRPDRDMVYPETYKLDFAGSGPIPTAEAVYNLILNKAKKAGRQPQCGSGSGGNVNPFEAQAPNNPEQATKFEELKTKLELAAGSISNMMKSIGVDSCDFQLWADASVGRPRFDPMKELRSVLGRDVQAAQGRLVETSWNKINRRGFSYLPGRIKYQPEVWVIVDTSGSMFNGEDGDNVLTEISGLLMRLGKIRVVTCDTVVTFDGLVKSVLEFKKVARGGGGTDLTPAFQRLEKDGTKGRVIVSLTDGCLNQPIPNSLSANAIWLLTSGSKQPWMKKCIRLTSSVS